MTPKRRAKVAAKLAAEKFGIKQRAARELILFWFDAEQVSPNAPVEVLARAASDYILNDAATS